LHTISLSEPEHPFELQSNQNYELSSVISLSIENRNLRIVLDGF
jgi:hypothetical protein